MKKNNKKNHYLKDTIKTFVIGQEAMVHGLTSEVRELQLNGEQVVVLPALDPQNGRHRVVLSPLSTGTSRRWCIEIVLKVES